MPRKAPCGNVDSKTSDEHFENKSTGYCLKVRQLIRGQRKGLYYFAPGGAKRYVPFKYRTQYEENKLNKIQNATTLPRLTYRQRKQIKEVIDNKEEKIKVGRRVLTHEDLKRMKPRKWLNDDMIGSIAYFLDEKYGNSKTMVRDSHIFYWLSKSASRSERKRTLRYYKPQGKKKEPVSKFVKGLKRIFYVINVHSSHWLLLEVDVVNEKAYVYNSMSGNLNIVKKAYTEHLRDLYSGKQFTFESVKAPQQSNGCDCGVFTLCALMARLKNEALTYKQSQINQYRLWFTYQLWKKYG